MQPARGRGFASPEADRPARAMCARLTGFALPSVSFNLKPPLSSKTAAWYPARALLSLCIRRLRLPLGPLEARTSVRLSGGLRPPQKPPGLEDGRVVSCTCPAVLAPPEAPPLPLGPLEAPTSGGPPEASAYL
ncbi:unnamed protein product [Prorocentrum cordatum]|uniref:Uncharacterized protein n=1 Tax=Prorocentrum cordatum TaxID=2364126 RepID=A0ABN9PZP2_9DINO|nr:unnamed protein product [Polarella glacialis]